MGNKVKLTTKLPGGEEWNGLDYYAEDIRADHTLMLGCWIVFDVPAAEVNYDSGTTTPKLRVRQVEVLTTDGSIPPELRELVESAFSERTGKQMLPLDEADGGPVEEEGDDSGEG